MGSLDALFQNETVFMVTVFVAVVSFVGLIAMILLAPKAKTGEEAPTAPTGGFGRQAGSDAYDWDEEWDEMVRESERGAMAKYLLPTEKKERKRLSERLMHAGLYNKNAVLVYSLSKIVMIGLAVLLGFAASSAGLMNLKDGLIAGALAGLLGTVGPSVWLDQRKKQRQTSLQRALPDALDVIVICVEAGLSLPASFKKVSMELHSAHPLLAGEFVIAQREIQMGCTTGEALRRFAGRFDLEELRSLAAVITQTEKFGASVVKALRVHADSLRIRRLHLAEERAQKAVVKLLIPTALFIFPALFVVVLGPAMFDIMRALDQF